MHRLHVVIAVAIVAAVNASAFGRGAGEDAYLLSADGKLVADLGGVRGALVDPEAGAIFHFHDGRIFAAALDKADKPLWSAAADPQIIYQMPVWRLLPQLVAVVGEKQIVGLDRASGKRVYAVDIGSFARRMDLSISIQSPDKAPANILYLVGDLDQHKRSAPDVPDADWDLQEQTPKHAATLGQFDLAAGKFVWQTPIRTPRGAAILPSSIDAIGVVHGRHADEQFFFDPATGKALDRAPEPKAPKNTAALAGQAAAPRIETTDDGIAYFGADGKRIWTFKAPASVRSSASIGDAVLVGQIGTEKDATIKAEVVKLSVKDGAEQWRWKLPHAAYADQMDIHIAPAKGGYLVEYYWLILD